MNNENTLGYCHNADHYRTSCNAGKNTKKNSTLIAQTLPVWYE